MQSAALLYQLTRNPLYLKDAQNIAKECYNYFSQTLQQLQEKALKC